MGEEQNFYKIFQKIAFRRLYLEYIIWRPRGLACSAKHYAGSRSGEARATHFAAVLNCAAAKKLLFFVRTAA
jgi:hypothetical protein